MFLAKIADIFRTVYCTLAYEWFCTMLSSIRLLISATFTSLKRAVHSLELWTRFTSHLKDSVLGKNSWMQVNLQIFFFFAKYWYFSRCSVVYRCSLYQWDIQIDSCIINETRQKKIEISFPNVTFILWSIFHCPIMMCLTAECFFSSPLISNFPLPPRLFEEQSVVSKNVSRILENSKNSMQFRPKHCYHFQRTSEEEDDTNKVGQSSHDCYHWGWLNW